MSKFSSVPARGMRDSVPSEVELRNYVKSVILDTYKQYGFEQVETPSLEKIDLLTNGDGGENVHLIYQILKRGKKLVLDREDLKVSDLVDLGLRFDLTVPLVRFYANNRGSLHSPFKSIQIGDVWRAERPQKGRFRQFIQCDIDIFGEESCLAEAQLILSASEALSKLGFEEFVIRINDRRILQQLALSAGFDGQEHDDLFIIVDKLDKLGMSGVKEECARKGFSQSKVDQFFTVIEELTNTSIPISEVLGKLQDQIDPQVLQNLITVIQIVQELSDAKVVYDPTLVRGMSYYTGQIYEIESEGFSGSIAGGGRYDNMLGRFLKESEPACGISIGFERILTILQEKEFKIPNQSKKLAYLIENQEPNQMKQLLVNAKSLREQGYEVSLLPRRKNLKKQLDQLKEHGFSSFCTQQDQIEIRKLK